MVQRRERPGASQPQSQVKGWFLDGVARLSWIGSQGLVLDRIDGIYGMEDQELVRTDGLSVSGR